MTTDLILKTALESGTHHGVDWAITVGGMIGLNGYAKIPTPHPLNELWLADGFAVYETFDDALGWRNRCLTYADQPWIGFDTDGCNDVWPTNTPYIGNASRPYVQLRSTNPSPDATHWTLDLVRDAVFDLCDTIAAYGVLDPHLPACTCPEGGAA